MRQLFIAALCAFGVMTTANADVTVTANSEAYSATCSAFDLRLHGVAEAVEIRNCHTVVVLGPGAKVEYRSREYLETLLEIPGAKLYVQRQGVVIVDLRHLRARSVQSKVQVRVLLVTKDEVIIRVQGKTYLIEDEALTGWNADQPQRFGTVRLKKSQIPADHYYRILRQSLPAGTPI